MPVLSLRVNRPGDTLTDIRLVEMKSDDTISTVTGAGYLNNYMIMNSIGLYTSDFVHVAASNGTQIYKPAFTNGTPQQGGSVQLVALA